MEIKPDELVAVIIKLEVENVRLRDELAKKNEVIKVFEKEMAGEIERTK